MQDVNHGPEIMRLRAVFHSHGSGERIILIEQRIVGDLGHLSRQTLEAGGRPIHAVEGSLQLIRAGRQRGRAHHRRTQGKCCMARRN